MQSCNVLGMQCSACNALIIYLCYAMLVLPYSAMY